MPQPIKAAITGLAAWVPEDKLTNFDLEKMVDTSDQWIRERTGIEERRILKEDKASSYLGIKAVQKLVDKTGTSLNDIDVVICTTVTPDYRYPPTASLIVEACGIDNAYCFDMNGTCSGFLYAIDIANAFVVSGRYKKVLIVCAEKLSSMADYEDRASCILFGDGGSAILVEPSNNGFGIIDSEMKAMTDGVMNIVFKGGGSAYPASIESVEKKWHYFWQDGKAVFKQAVMGMEEVTSKVMERNNVSSGDLRFVVPHQANKRIIDTIARRMNVEDKMVYNIAKFGNISTVTIPLALESVEDQLKKGDKLVLTAFGSGYTMGAVLLEWAI